MNTAISIIVPIYNREPVLRRCMDSIIAQNYHEAEIILVNDGSTDKSKEICLEYAKQDDRIVFIDQANAGVSKARNAGMQRATGRYLMFVDSDDYLETGAVSRLVSAAQRYDSDWIVGCVEKHIGDRTNAFSLQEGNASTEQDVQNTIQALENVYSFYQPVAKLYRTSLIKEHELYFRADLTRGEDFEFNCRYAKWIQSISLVNSVVYHYILGETENLSQAFYRYARVQDSVIFNSLRELHSSNTEIANQIQIEMMWASLASISSSKCNLRFREMARYVSDYRSIPGYSEIVNAGNLRLHWLKKSIMRMKNPYVMVGMILACARRRG